MAGWSLRAPTNASPTPGYSLSLSLTTRVLYVSGGVSGSKSFVFDRSVRERRATVSDNTSWVRLSTRWRVVSSGTILSSCSPIFSFAFSRRRTESLISLVSIRPVSTAVRMASWATHGFVDIRMRSAPDSRTRTAVSPTPYFCRTASMLRASVTTRSSKPISLRSRSVVTLDDSDAGVVSSSVSFGRARCPVMTLATPASMT
jgi:hypothetical protein